MQKSVPNASRSLTIKDHTTHRVVANDYLHNFSFKPTNIFSHAPNSCSFSSNYCILIQSKVIYASQFTQSMQSINSNHSQTQDFQIKSNHCIINQNCNYSNGF